MMAVFVMKTYAYNDLRERGNGCQAEEIFIKRERINRLVT